MNLIVHVPDDLANRITAAGADPEQLALAALRQAARELEQTASQPQDAADDRDQSAKRAVAREAGARIRQNRIGNTLPPGVTIRDLMTYGRD
jgi:hypothetical protein